MHITSLLLLLFLSVFAAYFDIKKRKIPDDIIKAGIFLKFLTLLAGYIFYNENILEQLMGLMPAAFFFLMFYVISFTYKRISNHPAFGGGDIKLIFVVSLFFDMHENIMIILTAFILSAISGIIYALSLKSMKMPFAPSLSAGLLFFMINNIRIPL